MCHELLLKPLLERTETHMSMTQSVMNAYQHANLVHFLSDDVFLNGGIPFNISMYAMKTE